MSTFFDTQSDLKSNMEDGKIDLTNLANYTSYGDMNLGNLCDVEIHEKLLPLIKDLSLRGIDVCIKKYENNYYFCVPICLAEDGNIYIDPRISKIFFIFEDLCMPNDITCIKFLDKFVSSSFTRSTDEKDFIDIFYANSSNRLHDCKPYPFEFSTSLYEIYPNYKSEFEDFSVFKVPDNVKNERIGVSKSFVWYLETESKYLKNKNAEMMSIKTFPSMSSAVNSVETLDYYNPDKPPTDEPNKWKKVVHRFRTEWILFDEYTAITPAAAPWIEEV